MLVKGDLDHVSRKIKRSTDNENHSSRRIKHLFLVSRKIILQNHASRLLRKLTICEGKIGHFTKGRSRVTEIPFTLLHSRPFHLQLVLSSP